MNKKIETLAWVTIFVSVASLWTYFGGLEAAISNSPEKFQALSVLFSAEAFAGLFFTIYQQSKGTKEQVEEAKILRRETAFFAEATNRNAEIEEFKQGVTLIGEILAENQKVIGILSDAPVSNIPELDAQRYQDIEYFTKNVERYTRIREVMVGEFAIKYLGKYDK